MKGFPDLPPLWLLGFCVLAWGVARFLPILDLGGVGLRTIGALLSFAGVGLIFWSGMWFLRKKTTIEPHESPTTLIIEGPYRLSRNPIYLGMVAILTGVVLWQGALSGVILPGLFVSVLSSRFIQPEEDGLRAAFGAEAEAYLERTRRWL